MDELGSHSDGDFQVLRSALLALFGTSAGWEGGEEAFAVRWLVETNVGV